MNRLRAGLSKRATFSFVPSWIREAMEYQVNEVGRKLEEDLDLFGFLDAEVAPCETCGKPVRQGTLVRYRCCSLGCATGLQRQGVLFPE